MKQKLIIICSIGFILGIVVASIFKIAIIWVVLLLVIPLLIIFWSNKKILFIVLVIFSLFVGYIRFIYSLPVNTEQNINYYNNESGLEWKDMRSILFRGRINQEIDKRIDHNKIIINSEEIFIDEEWKYVKGLVLAKAALYPEYEHGDELEIDCKLIKPSPIEGFAYDDYLSRYDIYSLCYSPRIKLISRIDGFNLKNYILKFKDQVHYTIQRNILEPESSVLSAMLLARRRDIPSTIVEDFSRTGVSHLLAISGMHIAIISLLIVRLLSVFSLPKKISYSGTLLFLFLYIFMIGFPASAVRAGIMGAIVLIAEYFGRINKCYFALLLVAIITLLINPKLIVYDIGWQLSFLAVLSLIFFSEDMEKLFCRMPKLFGIKAILQTTLAAQILTLPWLIYKFGQISLVFPIANILLLPALPLIMSLSVITIIITFIFPILATPLYWIIWNLIHKQIEVISWLSSFSNAAMQISKVPIIYIMFVYIMIILFKIKPRKSVMN